MIQKEMIEYQSLDAQLNKIERDLKKDESFLKRREIKVALRKTEDQIARFEQRTVELRNQLAQLTANLQKINEIVDEYSHEMDDIEDQDELNYISKKLDGQMELLAAVEKDLKRILQEGEKLSVSFEKTRAQLPKLAAEYNKYNEQFNKAANAQKPLIMQIKCKQVQLEKQIESNLFSTYKRIKEQTHPVFVPLQDGNRCGGCRMEVPTSQVSSKLQQNGYMVCEHCGRVIYLP